MTLTLATAQIPVTARPDINGAAARTLMTQAAQRGARLIHFTEGALCGYPHQKNAPDWEAIEKQMALITDLARALKLWTVIGTRRLGGPSALYVISHRGEPEASHIFDTSTTIITVDGVRCGLIKGNQIRQLDMILRYSARHTDALLMSCGAEGGIYDILARSHALTQNLWTSLAVPTQFSHVQPSGIAAPTGHWADQCYNPSEPDLACATLT